MIDLAKPLGIHNDIIFYGDHEHDDLVYYFPDQVGLARQVDGRGDQSELYELFFQIFHEGTVSDGGIEDLRKSAGSILQLGVECSVHPKRLEQAIESLKGIHVLPEDLRISTPMWKDGSVHLLALDAITSNADSMNDDAFVKSIIGTHKPSLMSSDLKSIFNVRFDRRGTGLISAALEGGTGSVAGVLYDLKYPAIRPAVDLRIWADLGRCYESVSHSIGVKAEFQYYVKFSLGAELEWITKKLEENGDIKIELLSQVEDAETKKMVDEMVKEFKDSILRELFTPYVNPSIPTVIDMSGMTPEIGVSYKFKKEKIDHGKIIEVDYRERSTTIRTHNPQSHLWLFGRQIESNRDKYITNVVFNRLWREQELNIQFIHDFTNEQLDLLSAEVVVWRKKDGIADAVESGRFFTPDDAQVLKHVTFHKDAITPVRLGWIYDDGEEIGYHYQIRFLYSGRTNNISSPSEIVIPPVFSSNQDLVIFPDTYTYFRQIEVRQGNISFIELVSVDILLQLKDKDGVVMDVETISLNANNPGEVWTVRGPDKGKLFIEASRMYHYNDDRPSIKTDPVYLLNDEIIVNKPLKRSSFQVIPVIAGGSEAVREVLLKIILNSPDLSEPIINVHRILGPDFLIDPIEVALNSNEDEISYVAQVITQDDQLIEVQSGIIDDNALIIDLKKVHQKEIQFIWEGVNPAAADLKYLRIELRSRSVENDIEDLQRIEYKGDDLPEPVIRTFDRDLIIEMKMIKRFFDGTKEKGSFFEIEEDEVIISP